MRMKSELDAAVNPIDTAANGGAIPPRRSLGDDVHDRLIELLLAETTEPGAKLPIDALARAWQVSQTPIREALVRAEESGLVVRETSKGYQVAPLLSPEEFIQLMEARLLIEPYCAALACQRIDDTTLQILEQQHIVMSEAPRGPTAHDYREYLRADIAFHETISAAAGNRFLTLALAVTGMHAHRFRRFIGGNISDAPDALSEHLAILNALRTRDRIAASAAMREHLIGVTERGRVETPTQK